ncbi:MAG TPA: MmcQ/YjbR family DNA-binding protein [Flavisolibacter sp.]|nr:MmcQ/YjbR family DNA-binding protein [Flavisolibacter sp.]
MVSINSFRKMALAFEQVEEKPHFNKASFRVKGKIIATLDSKEMKASLRLTEADQSVYCLIKPQIAVPATGAWGKQGWTVIDIQKAPKIILKEALTKAYLNSCPVVKTKSVSSRPSTEKIQTLHPDKNKTNKKISVDKYNTIKDNLLKILKIGEVTHTELMELLYQNVKDSFQGGVQWYGETVKLDLEARKIIERTGTKPEKYRLKTANR